MLVTWFKRGVNTAFTPETSMPQKRGIVVADFVGHQDGLFRLETFRI